MIHSSLLCFFHACMAFTGSVFEVIVILQKWSRCQSDAFQMAKMLDRNLTVAFCMHADSDLNQKFQIYFGHSIRPAVSPVLV